MINCEICSSVYHEKKTKKVCIRCYPYILKLNRIKKWDINVPKTLSREYPNCLSNYMFEFFKQAYINYIKMKLLKFKTQEEMINNNAVTSLDIEYKLRSFNEKANKEFFHYCNNINGDFDQPQKSIIYRMLLNLESNIVKENSYANIVEDAYDLKKYTTKPS